MTSKRVYLVSFIASFAVALGAYVNSSFIEGVLGHGSVGFIYAIGSFLTLIALEHAPRVLRRIGNYRMFVILSFGGLSCVLLFAGGYFKFIVTLAFLIYLIVINLISYSFDVFLEKNADKKKEGGLRGGYLTIVSIGWLFAPILAGILINTLGFSGLYAVIATFFVIVIMLGSAFFKKFRDAPYTKRSVLKTFHIIKKRPNIVRISFSEFMLNFFFCWMVLFTPLYLHQVIGLSFKEIGVIFSIMLLPFVLLEYPLGKLADERLGEKELLIAGFVIASGATLCLALYHGKNLAIFASILFMTRVGASMMQTMNATYFFSKITNKDPDIISFFRSMAPLGYMLGSLLAGILLLFVTYQTFFIMLAVMLALSTGALYSLRDTR